MKTWIAKGELSWISEACERKDHDRGWFRGNRLATENVRYGIVYCVKSSALSTEMAADGSLGGFDGVEAILQVIPPGRIG